MCHAREREHPEYHGAIRLAASRRVRRLPGLRCRFVVSPRLDPRFRGDDTCWLGRRNAAVVSSPLQPPAPPIGPTNGPGRSPPSCWRHDRRSRVLMAEAVVILPPDVRGQEIVERSDRAPPLDLVGALQPSSVLIDHRIDNMDEGLVAGEKSMPAGQQISLDGPKTRKFRLFAFSRVASRSKPPRMRAASASPPPARVTGTA